MSLFADIPYQQAQINLYNNKIWCGLSYNYLKTRTAAFLALPGAVNQLATAFSQVIEETMTEDYPLEYNQNIMRNFSLFKYTSNAVTYYNLTLSYNSAIENYINCGKIMSDEALLDRMRATSKYLVQQQAYFITANGD